MIPGAKVIQERVPDVLKISIFLKVNLTRELGWFLHFSLFLQFMMDDWLLLLQIYPIILWKSPEDLLNWAYSWVIETITPNSKWH